MGREGGREGGRCEEGGSGGVEGEREVGEGGRWGEGGRKGKRRELHGYHCDIFQGLNRLSFSVL